MHAAETAKSSLLPEIFLRRCFWRAGVHQDAHEWCFLRLLDSQVSEAKQLKRLFAGRMPSFLKCPQCANSACISQEDDTIFTCLDIPTHNGERNLDTTDSGLQHFFHEEPVAEDFVWGGCSQCGARAERPLKFFKMTSKPLSLCLKLNYFDRKGNELTHHVALSELVVLDGTPYRLRSVVYHRGNQHFGHYWASVRHAVAGEESWWLYNDSIRKRMESPDCSDTHTVSEGRTYMLFYSQERGPVASSSTSEESLSSSQGAIAAAPLASAAPTSSQVPAPPTTSLSTCSKGDAVLNNEKQVDPRMRPVCHDNVSRVRAVSQDIGFDITDQIGDMINAARESPLPTPTTAPVSLGPGQSAMPLPSAPTSASAEDSGDRARPVDGNGIDISSQLDDMLKSSCDHSNSETANPSSTQGTWQRKSRPDDEEQLFGEEPPPCMQDPDEEDSLSAESEADANSDDEDIFQMKVCSLQLLPSDYSQFRLYRWKRASLELTEHLRDDVLLPPNPGCQENGLVWKDVNSGVVLPPWHCAFSGCHATATSLAHDDRHEGNLWNHIWGTEKHKKLLCDVIKRYDSKFSSADMKEAAFTLYGMALAEKERGQCPLVGLSTDRRTLGHVGEVFAESNVSTLMCFICSCKHICHEGVDKFGEPVHKGTIAYRCDVARLRELLTKTDKELWKYNLSAKFYKDRFGHATAAAPDLQADCFEWIRSIRCANGTEELLCCPEDVVQTELCSHGKAAICPRCRIPVCSECWHYSCTNTKNPKALANDNFIGYAHIFLVEHNVTWLEATIAGPVFSGLVTYYIEGNATQRGHMMETAVGKPERAWGVRGNLFSFLLPWEKVMEQLFKKVEAGDLSDWPLDRWEASKVVRVRLVRGPEQILDKCRDLHVRSWVIRRLAHIYIERHIADLANRPGVLKIHAYMQQKTVDASLKAHVDQRVAKFYPAAEYGTPTGKVLPEIVSMAPEQQQKDAPRSTDSAFDFKQTAMPDVVESEVELFSNVRPSIVTDEGYTANTLNDDVVAEYALKSVSGLTVKMSNHFENQFVSKYTTRIFPWALNYDCGGAEYPDLFADWDELLSGEKGCLAASIQQRWRRLADEAPLVSGDYAAMLSTRPEVQVAGDWMLVPAARNLHWRYAVLHSAFVMCKQKISPGESLLQNLTDLVEATKTIWSRIASNVVTINQQKKNINGNMSMLFAADDLTNPERIILRSYMNVTASIAGCQQIRKKIGACCFGLRVVHGECVFVTVTPSQRHSSMILKLSRSRFADVGNSGQDSFATTRRRFASSTVPNIFSTTNLTADPTGQILEKEIPLPDLVVRQKLLAQDPLAIVHHYLVFMYVVLPAIFGVRMCFHCPDCNADADDWGAAAQKNQYSACSDYMGYNMKFMGGFAGLATAMGFATEFQGSGTPHGHGFVSLVNMYQHLTLEEIGDMIEKSAKSLTSDDLLTRVINFVEHLQREDHFDDEEHQRNLRALEREFHANNEGPLRNRFLSARPRFLYERADKPYLWSQNSLSHVRALSQNAAVRALSQDVVEKEADEFRKLFEQDVQFIFSHVQHHWHLLNKEGKRVPMPYCQPSKRNCTRCKRDFPKKVLRGKNGKVRLDRYRARIVCKGVAAELELKISGRRNALGSISGRRRCEYFSGTAAVLAAAFLSNTNVQLNYRVPLTSFTHDKDCKYPNCTNRFKSRKLCLIAQRAMKQMTGYFGGYIGKQQKVGQYDLKKSISTLPLFHEKLAGREVKTASAQLAHVVNRMFTTLESKGILRAAPEDFLLASRYKPHDPLAAEFIRTFRSRNFPGNLFVERYEVLSNKSSTVDVRVLLPKNAAGKGVIDIVSLYGWRPQNTDLWYLSPWEFAQWVLPVRLRPPAVDYFLTIWTAVGKKKVTQAKGSKLALEPGVDFILNEKYVRTFSEVYAFPNSRHLFSGQVPTTYETFRSTWILQMRQRPMVPTPEVRHYYICYEYCYECSCKLHTVYHLLSPIYFLCGAISPAYAQLVPRCMHHRIDIDFCYDDQHNKKLAPHN